MFYLLEFLSLGGLPRGAGRGPNPKSNKCVDMSVLIWYNRGMEKFSFRTFFTNGDMLKIGSGKHYEGPKIIQEFADITKGAKKVRSFG